MSKTVALLLLFLCFFTYGYNTPGGNDKGLVRKANRAFRKSRLADALNYYLKALTINPEDCYANFQAGAIYYLTDSAKMKSMPYFKNTLKYASAKDTIIDAYYYLGNCYILKQEYTEAISAFQRYLAHLIDDEYDAPIVKEVQHNIAMCRQAPELMQRTADSASYIISGKYQPAYIKNLGSLINTPYPEYAQVVMDNDSTLVFTSRRPASQKGKREYATGSYYEDIFISKKANTGQWMAPSLFSTQLNIKPGKLNLASVCVSGDGKTLFIYHKGLIYESHKNGKDWSKLQRIGAKIKSLKKYMPSVFLSYDGKELFIVSDKKGGYGGRDIYVSTHDSAGIWSEPQNLGPEINTPYDEDAPFLMPDNKTLFFSSKGHSGLGGYDIFKSVCENGKWSPPVNVGAPVNSPADDIFFSYDTATQKGYFSSSRINEGYGDMDLYSLSFTCDNIDSTTLKGKIVSDGNGNPAAILELTVSATQKTFTAKSDELGNYSLQLKPDTKYSVTQKAPGYIPSTFSITTPHQCDVYNLYQLIYLNYITSDSLRKGQNISINDAFYHTDFPGYTNAKSSPDISAFINSYKDTADIRYRDTSFTLNYTPAQIDSLNPHATKLAVNSHVSTSNITLPVLPKFPVVLFELNSTKINVSYYPSLDSIAKIMRANSKIKLQVTGFTDNTGTEKHNIQLSLRRAKAVAHYLVKKGVKPIHIHAVGNGVSNPAAPNDGTHNYLNRRAELMLIE